MKAIEVLFKGLFVDYTSIVEYSITKEITKVTWERYGVVFSEKYNTEKLFGEKKKVKID